MEPDVFPGLLGEIAEVAGETSALAIAQAVGGTRVTIPARLPEDHWLVDVVGSETAALICDHFRTLSAEGTEVGLQQVVIPLGPASTLSRARRQLAKGLEAGLSVREAARRAGLSERAAWRTKAKMRGGDGGQGNLF
ncbi:hypothetical protein [Breoghania sp.]|uniref:hypothetical protein n=1 Tax=Breoghania sp. TaxID=2065378 RepID=UPI0029CA20C7|nr:hypothetical protein [Breoghania sp.]